MKRNCLVVCSGMVTETLIFPLVSDQKYLLNQNRSHKLILGRLNSYLIFTPLSLFSFFLYFFLRVLFLDISKYKLISFRVLFTAAEVCFAH